MPWPTLATGESLQSAENLYAPFFAALLERVHATSGFAGVGYDWDYSDFFPKLPIPRSESHPDTETVTGVYGVGHVDQDVTGQVDWLGAWADPSKPNVNSFRVHLPHDWAYPGSDLVKAGTLTITVAVDVVVESGYYYGVKYPAGAGDLVYTFTDDGNGNLFTLIQPWSIDHGAYNAGDVVKGVYGETDPDAFCYVCILAHLSAAEFQPPNPTYWRQTCQYAGTIEYGNLVPGVHPSGTDADPLWIADRHTGAVADITLPVSKDVAVNAPWAKVTASWTENRTVLATSGTPEHPFGSNQGEWEGCYFATGAPALTPVEGIIDYAEAGGQMLILRGTPGNPAVTVPHHFTISPVNAPITAETFRAMQQVILNTIPAYVDHTVQGGDFTDLLEIPMFTLESFKVAAGVPLFPRVPSTWYTVSGTYSAETAMTNLVQVAGPNEHTPIFHPDAAGHQVHIWGVGQFTIAQVLGDGTANIEGCHEFTNQRVAVLPLDWTDPDDVAFIEGLAVRDLVDGPANQPQPGDVIGPWLFHFLKIAIQTLKWTVVDVAWKGGEYREAASGAQADWDAATAAAKAAYDTATHVATDGPPNAYSIFAHSSSGSYHSVAYHRLWCPLHYGPFTDQAHGIGDRDIDFYVSAQGMGESSGYDLRETAWNGDWPGGYGEHQLWKWTDACLTDVAIQEDDTPGFSFDNFDVYPVAGSVPDPEYSVTAGWTAADCTVAAVVKWHFTLD